MAHNPHPWNNDFFVRSWQCPFRRWWRYGRRLLLVFVSGVFLWVSLDLLAITIANPESHPPVSKLLLHAALTVMISLGLTGITQQLYLRFNSRFKPLKAFFQRGKPPPILK
jgi:TRAP-type C4-dicarboxylate transport system permease small subunit